MPRYMTVVLVFLIASLLRADVADLDERFDAPASTAWTTELRVPDVHSLTWPRPGEPGGLRFESRGLGLATRPWAIGHGPFEFSAEVAISKGESQPWRNNGIAISLSSSPVDQMGKSDWAVLFAAVQQGAIATVVRNGAMYAAERRPGVLAFLRQDIAPRLQLSMAGGGGLDYSVAWPVQETAGTTLRFHIWRDGQDMMHLRIFHSDGVAAPWWEAQAKLPADLAKVDLNYVTIQTTREADQFVQLSRDVAAGSVWKGTVRRVQGRKLDGGAKPSLDQPFPTATLAGPERGDRRSFMLPPGGLAELRAKFDDPMFADYRTILLRNATPAVADKIPLADPMQSNRLSAVLWAYLLTGQAEYRQRMLEEIDILIGASDKLPAAQWGSPGHLRQGLDIREFMGHNVAELAVAYDLLGNELDGARRDRMRYLLVRAVRNYLQRLEVHDWWYDNNPSNTIGVGNGTMGLAALALRDDAPRLSETAIDQAIATFRKAFQAVRPDGSCIEGNMYWNYGLSYPLLLGYALRNATGDDRGLLGSEPIGNAQQYVQVNLGGNDEMIPFNDTQPWLNGWLVCAHAGSQFDQPLMRWMADHMAKQFAVGPTFPEQDRADFAIEAFLLRDRKPSPQSFPGVPTLLSLTGVNEGVMRSEGSVLTPRLVVGIKGKGTESTHHANQDQGSFVLYARGEMLLLDPGYFELEASKHSLPLLGGAADMKFDPQAACPISDEFEAGSLRSMTVDATAAYSSGPNAKAPLAQRVRRVFVQAGDQALVVLDDIVPTTGSERIVTQFQAGFAAQLKGPEAVVQGKQGDLHIRLFGPETTLAVTPRTFAKQWVYARLGVQWQTISGAYACDPRKPLVSVLLPVAAGANAPRPEVNYGDDRIDVKIGDAVAITFAREGGLWKARRP